MAIYGYGYGYPMINSSPTNQSDDTEEDLEAALPVGAAYLINPSTGAYLINPNTGAYLIKAAGA